MSITEWFPPDDFYEGYSLYHHFGYGPEEELNITSYMLRKEGYPVDIDIVRATLELTRDLANKIQKTCKSEIATYEERTRVALVVGGVVPAPVQIAKAIVIRILKMAAGKIRSLTDKLTTSEDERIITKVVEKLKVDNHTNEIIVKRTESYSKTYRIAKKRGRKT